MFDLCGYSERGMMNALFYDINGAPTDSDRLKRLHAFLSLCRFPNNLGQYPFRDIRFQSAKIRIEQSFSGFGDPDTLILLDEDSAGDARKHAIILEAKVKTDQKNAWYIRDEWREFLGRVAQQQSDSNLFIQLYRKLRLVRHLLDPGEEVEASSVPGCWRIGTNKTVKQAGLELAEYCESVWYLSILPDSATNVERFYRQILSGFTPNEDGRRLPGWDVSRWGFLCWSDLRQFCEQQDQLPHWPGLRRNFEYNGPQIYVEQPTGGSATLLTREGLQEFLQSLSTHQKAILQALAMAGGALKQRQLLDQLPFLDRASRKLGSLKASINAACDEAGFPRLLVRGTTSTKRFFGP